MTNELSERVAAVMGDCDGFGSVNFRDGRHVCYCSDCGQRDELGHDDECQWLLIRDLDAERLRLEKAAKVEEVFAASLRKERAVQQEEIESLRAELREAEVDAGRYRQARWQLVDFGIYSNEQAAENAIDAAIAAAKEGK